MLFGNLIKQLEEASKAANDFSVACYAASDACYSLAYSLQHYAVEWPLVNNQNPTAVSGLGFQPKAVLVINEPRVRHIYNDTIERSIEVE